MVRRIHFYAGLRACGAQAVRHSCAWCIQSIFHNLPLSSNPLTQPHPTAPNLAQVHPTSPNLTQPHPTSPNLTQTHPTSPNLTKLTQPHPTSPNLTIPHLTSPNLTQPHPTSFNLTQPLKSDFSKLLLTAVNCSKLIKARLDLTRLD